MLDKIKLLHYLTVRPLKVFANFFNKLHNFLYIIIFLTSFKI